MTISSFPFNRNIWMALSSIKNSLPFLYGRTLGNFFKLLCNFQIFYRKQNSPPLSGLVPRPVCWAPGVYFGSPSWNFHPSVTSILQTHRPVLTSSASLLASLFPCHMAGSSSHALKPENQSVPSVHLHFPLLQLSLSVSHTPPPPRLLAVPSAALTAAN